MPYPRCMSGKASGYQKFFQDARRNSGGDKSMTPEQQVLRHLAQQANNNKKQKRSRRRPPPFFALVLLGVSLLAGTVGILSPNAFDSAEAFDSTLASMNIPIRLASLPKVNIGFLGHAFGAEKEAVKDTAKVATPAADKKTEPAKKSAGTAETAGDKQPAEAAAGATKVAEANPDLKQWTSEEMSFFKRLNDRKLELDRREAELAKLEEELQKQRVGIEEKIKQLEKTRAEISATLKGRVEQDQEKVAKLVDVYSNMKPQSASKVIESLNEDLAVTILDKMKKKNAAEILNTMSSAKAKRLSEMLTGYRQPASAKESE